MARPSGGFRRSSWRGPTWLLLASLGLLLPGIAPARAAEQENRDFDIVVDGKRAGDYQMTITRQDDGTLTLAARSDVQVKVLLLTAYAYSYRGQEVWRGGRLQTFASSGKENGRPFSVSARAEAGTLRVNANGLEHTARPDVWTTSCWQLPAAPLRNQSLPLLRCDNGQETTGRLQYVGTERMRVAGQDATCVHYRLTREVPYDLWYDGSERLVREEWTADGHRTQIVLTGLRR
jgi:hypothetical protein